MLGRQALKPGRHGRRQLRRRLGIVSIEPHQLLRLLLLARQRQLQDRSDLLVEWRVEPSDFLVMRR